MQTILPYLNKMKNPGTRVIVEELYRADKEEGIRLLQRALVHLGKTIAIDGELGDITTAAVKSVNNRALHGAIWDLLHPTPIQSLDHLPAWVAAGLNEIGVHEIHGARHNPRVIAYMNATKWGKWVHDDETPWCAGFVGWCMVQAGLRDQIPDYSLGAKSWLHFGVSAHKPVFGAIAVKSRHGGGHVGIVVGRNRKRGTLYILGGNQNDAVSVKEYPERVWIDFRIPHGYRPNVPLKKYAGVSSLAGSEA